MRDIKIGTLKWTKECDGGKSTHFLYLTRIMPQREELDYCHPAMGKNSKRYKTPRRVYVYNHLQDDHPDVGSKAAQQNGTPVRIQQCGNLPKGTGLQKIQSLLYGSGHPRQGNRYAVI